METVRIIFPLFVGPIRLAMPRNKREALTAARAAVADFHVRMQYRERERRWELRAAERARQVKVAEEREKRKAEQEMKGKQK